MDGGYLQAAAADGAAEGSVFAGAAADEEAAAVDGSVFAPSLQPARKSAERAATAAAALKFMLAMEDNSFEMTVVGLILPPLHL